MTPARKPTPARNVQLAKIHIAATKLDAAGAVQQWIAEQQPQLYRPSNGTEGDSFQSAWCDICARFDEGSCSILQATMQFDVTAREYPKEWHLDPFGQPQCDAYILEGELVPPPRCERTADLFGDAP